MGYFKPQHIERLKLASNPDYWVDVIDNIQYGDTKKWMDLDAKQKSTGGFSTTGDRFLLSVIKAWNLDDDEGNILPIDMDSINRLEQEDVLLIIERAGGEVETDDAKKNSSKTS